MTLVKHYDIINITKNEREGKQMEKRWDNVGYAVMALLLIGQVTVGWLFMVGQGAYLIGNMLNVIRDFKLDRPKADKVKNICFTAITVGLIILYIF